MSLRSYQQQARLLAKHGLPTEVSFPDAKEIITAIADHGWRCPDWLPTEAWEAAAA